ncbi:glycosyltransferase family 2 protein [Halotalea alkalilenta]|uniref:glycosyltransferase family 2 protein n=1 Tax=Halotalea alkalilenta TaxID=376489 RepID=UPI0004870EBC|nr:glycosyltransferase family 2 protein [Halotalea alkalilenta]
MAEPRVCALIPFYNHPAKIAKVCRHLAALGLPILLVDDGSDEDSARVVDAVASAGGHRLVRLERNRGKGAAVRAGLKEAERLGYTHALQMDADGQQHPGDVAAFLASMRARPGALAAGYPIYDHSVPRVRFYGRYATHVWVWINTLSMAIRDTMCGLRLYPVAAVNRMLERHDCGDRMSFDTEILVRWYWGGGEVVNLPVRIDYPEDGVSHFALLKDNLHISWMHTRLFFGMLIRLPRLLKRRWGRDG